MNKNKNFIILVIVQIVLICIIAFSSFLLVCTIFGIDFIGNNYTPPKNDDVVIVEDDYSDIKEIYEKNKEINDDYIGQIYFESGLIDLPFVQGETNDTYLRTDWQSGKYEIGGSIFLESTNDIDNDQNIIIYGHNYPESYDNSLSKMFTPLRFLKENDYYNDNKFINLFLGNKILRFEIVTVFRVKIVEEDGVQYIGDDEPIYVLRNYSENEFNEYIDKVKQRQYYDTGISISNSDRLLTLQTCFDDSIDKLIVLAKLIEEIPIN